MTTYRADGLVALADPTRRAIFERLGTGPRSVAELAGELPISRPAVSQHLKVLKDARLVTVRPEGTRRIYAVDPAGLQEIRRYFDRFWTAALADFAAAADAFPDAAAPTYPPGGQPAGPPVDPPVDPTRPTQERTP